MQKFNTRLRLLLICVFILSFTISVSAHPGRTDSNGGHYNRKTGEYHYHNGSSAGKNSGGDSDSYSYSNFVGPTADYNSDSNKSEKPKDEDTLRKEKAINTLKLDAIIVAVICIAALLYCLISKKNIQKNKPTITYAPLSEEETQKMVDKFRAEDRKRWQQAWEEQERTTNKRLEQIAGFPDGIYIDGFTFNDTNSTEPYGRATAYINHKNKTLHLFENCDNATHPINMLFDTYEMKNFKLCEKCQKSGKYNFYLNYESWYKEYIKMKIADENNEHENI